MANIVRDDPKHTRKIFKILKERLTSIILSCLPEYCIDVAVKGDLVLMESLSSIYDNCWEIKFKTVFKVLLLSSRYVFTNFQSLQQNKSDFRSFFCFSTINSFDLYFTL